MPALTAASEEARKSLSRWLELVGVACEFAAKVC